MYNICSVYYTVNETIPKEALSIFLTELAGRLRSNYSVNPFLKSSEFISI